MKEPVGQKHQGGLTEGQTEDVDDLHEDIIGACEIEKPRPHLRPEYVAELEGETDEVVAIEIGQIPLSGGEACCGDDMGILGGRREGHSYPQRAQRGDPDTDPQGKHPGLDRLRPSPASQK